ncbi:Hexokinase-1 [Drechslerella dactyloides]|uniref:Phosphotransferase n=1 Tax=Drechslerella dactyloides TaxID=74499 RepID=A0AAD6J1F9_DREDA|nr:Hexokinase-1 [Drechslerella dactyloides]
MTTSSDQLKDTLQQEFPLDLSTPRLLEISSELTAAFHDGLHNSTAAMLPSHIYTLPTGTEQGKYIAADLGGSTLRVALVQLAGDKSRSLIISDTETPPMTILEMKTWGGSQIEHLKTLTGDDFFDWIARRIEEIVEVAYKRFGLTDLRLGLSWSFPIESTSLDSGKVQGMGKGFVVADSLLGTDLKTHFTNAFSRLGLKISLDAIVNDSLATLLSHAYTAPATRTALILGTGTNASVSLPLSMLPSEKLAQTHLSRPLGAQEVLVNTELSMFGKGIYPVTKWDDALDAAMPRPGFQPLEYLIGGRYVGEIARRVVVDLEKERGLFGSKPLLWNDPYSLKTEILANIEVCPDDKFPNSYKEIHPSLDDAPLSFEDAMALKMISHHVSSRAANYCAIALHALVKFREHESVSLPGQKQNIVPIGFVGSVMEKYPGLLERTQAVLDRLTGWSPGDVETQRILLEFAPESAIFGAAVAVAAAYSKPSTPPTASNSVRTSNSLPDNSSNTTDTPPPQPSPNFFVKRFKSLSGAKKTNSIKKLKKISLPPPSNKVAPPKDANNDFSKESHPAPSILTSINGFFSQYLFHKVLKK